MPSPNPSTGPIAVPLRVPARHRGFLAEALEAIRPARDGTERAERDSAAIDRILTGLRTGSIVPDLDAVRLVEALRDATDAGNEYGRVVLEHVALVGLLDQLDWGTH